MPAPSVAKVAKEARGGGGDGGEGDKDKKKVKTLENSSSSGDSMNKDKPQKEKPVKKRKDGTPNKMSFDVDELEEGLYVQVEDEEDVEEVVEYEEIPEGEDPEAPVSTDPTKKDAPKENWADNIKPVVDDGSGYKIRPDLSQKFRPGTVQIIIENAIKDKLEGKEYSTEECEEWVKQIGDDVHERVKSQNYKRYKIITQITLGERRGEGASSATRCLWDAEADCMATYTFLNDSIFCNGTVYGIYFY